MPVSLLLPSMTTSAAAESLSETWLSLKEMGSDTELFVDTYVSRSFASLVQIFGTDSLSRVGQGNDGFSPNRPYSVTVGSNKEPGFHSWAFGPYSNLDNLDAAQERLVQGASGSGGLSARTVSSGVDTRHERWESVLEYIKDLDGVSSYT